MMIKALIIIHFWSLVIAGCAWFLQRDGKRRIGSQFPSPNVWLSLIALSLLPGIISVLPFTASMNFMDVETFEIMPDFMNVTEGDTAKPFNYFMIYLFISAGLVSQTLWRWLRLQQLTLTSTHESSVFTTLSVVPPLTLSWPRRAIVIPQGQQGQAALIAHERAHLSRCDAELTICLLVLRDLMLRTPAMAYLIKQWRLAIELRADHAATQMLTTSERRDYANLLISSLKSNGVHKGGRALPCPTAHLTSTRNRSVKMRLNSIMTNNAKPRKYRWRAAILMASAGSSLLGILSHNAVAKDEGIRLQADQIRYIERVPPKMPLSCAGLKVDDIDIQWKDITVGDETTKIYTATVGSVVLKYDVGSDGGTENIRVVKSNHSCFEPRAKTSLAQWKIEKQEDDIRDVVVIIRFMLTGETQQELEATINSFVQ